MAALGRQIYVTEAASGEWFIETVEREVKDKARELGVLEALSTKNAIRVTKVGAGEVGTCTITLSYKRIIDFYGVYKFTLETDKRITKPIFENIS